MIIFKKVRAKNIFSYGNYWTEIDFEKNRMTLIQGKNGQGKTCIILDSVIYCLFGVPYRNINKPNIVNSVNQKDCLVEIEFDIGTKQYKVVRGIKPNIFEIWCDGSLVNQAATSKDYQKYLEQNILKLNYKAFTQLVLLGSSNFTPFMNLPAAERREVIEELLDIGVFSRMNIVLKERISLAKEKSKELDKDLAVIKEKQNNQQNLITKLEKKSEESVNSIQIEIDNNQNSIHSLQKEIDDLTESVKLKNIEISKVCNTRGSINKLKSIEIKLDDQNKKIDKSVKFLSETQECPTCSQQISQDFKNKSIEEKLRKQNEIENGFKDIKNRLSNLEKDLILLEKLENELNILNSDLSTKITSIISLQKYIQKLEIDKIKIKNSTQEIEQEKKVKETIDSELLLKEKEKHDLINQKHLHDVATMLLKDSGIKTKIVKQYLPLMNKYINKYLTSMDFFANFNLDENFNAVVKSRHRDTFEYNSFSQGEKFRIDMSLLLTWREIAKKKNSTNTNILIMDEVFDGSLDANGIDEYLKLLKTLSKSIHIFVISHKSDALSDKFDGNIKVEKKGNFSYIK